jgi:hypothetical protein
LRQNLIHGQALLKEVFALGFERARRADTHTLAAKHASAFRQRFVKKGTDLGLETASLEIDCVRILGVFRADLDAAPA